MSGRIRRTPRARADLLAIHDYINDDNPSAAARFLAAADECFRLLAEFPEAGRAWSSDRPELAGVRAHPIPRFANYLVFYRPASDGILVLAVLHAARDLDNVLPGYFGADR